MVIPDRRIRRPAVWCCVVVLAALAAGASSPAWAGPPASPASESAAHEDSDLRYHASVLQNPANPPPTRTGAARRLLQMGIPQAVALLESALRSGDPAQILPVVRAMGSLPKPSGGLMSAAVDTLRTAPQEILDELAIAVAKYEASAFPPVSRLAADRSLPAVERTGAVYALGLFPTRESGDLLMELADPQRGEPEAVRTVAFDALRRLAGLDLGHDYRRWRTWWSKARDQSRADWARDLVRQYQDRNAELERLHGQVVDRYVELLKDLYRTLPVERQLQRLERDIEDELIAVRQFAIQRIGRLLRDSEILPDSLRQRVAARLDDGQPSIRRQAAEVLNEMNLPDFGAMIADRLQQETDHQVLATYLELLRRRPTAAAWDSLLLWLENEHLGQAASEALWQVLAASSITEAQQEEAYRRVRQVFQSQSSAGTARLLAYFGHDEDVRRLEGLLDGEDHPLRLAIAEGFSRRGLHEPLVRRSGDESIYPFAVRAVAVAGSDLTSLQLLASLVPPPAQVPPWEQAVRAVTAKLAPEDLVAADAILEQLAHATLSLRSMVLLRGAVLPPEALAAAPREQLLLRLGPMLIELGEPLRAMELMEGLNGTGDSAPLHALRLRAAVFAGRFEAAAQICPDAAPWVRLFEELATTRPEVARPLGAEIAARFADRLEGDLKLAFDTGMAALPAEPNDAIVEGEAESP